MATLDQIKIRVERLKTVAEVDAEIDRITRTTRVSGSYNLPETQEFLAALQTRKQQLTEQPAPRVPNFTPGGNAKRGGGVDTSAGGGRGVVNDDRGNPPIPKKINNTKTGPHPVAARPIDAPAPAVATPTTQAGEVGTLAAKFGKPKPGKRLENPLSSFSSYTYQISLYMITPDAYNAFIDSGRTDINAIRNITAAGEQTIAQANQQTAAANAARESFIDTQFVQGVGERGRSTSTTSPPAASSTIASTVNKGGAYLIAQSGGINNSSEQRAPGFDTDFYIEDLKFTHFVSPNESQAAATNIDISFKIIEPSGFSFISKLTKAQSALQASSSALGYNELRSSLRNTFVLGIKFLGYDENGELIDPNKYSSTLGLPVGNASGIYERFIDILISEMKFKLDGKSVTYNIEAKEASLVLAFGIKRGIIEHTASVQGSNVREALSSGSGLGGEGLLSKLNKDQKYLKDTGAIEIASEWDIKFLGDAEKIANASLISPADLDKRFWKQSDVKNANESNQKKADKNPPNNTLRTISFTNGTPILQAINQIIKQSSYLEKALLAVTKSETEPDKTNPITAIELNNPSPTVIEWYNIRPEIQNLGWDNKQKDFVYKTTYYIQTYSTPYTLSAYAGLTSPYYGPVKRYDYWFTGKNSELLKIDMSFDNNFYITTMLGSPDYDGGKAGLNDIPVIAGKQQNQAKQGYLNYGAEAQNSYMASLYDPKAWTTSKLTILGDPDFLMAGVTNNLEALDDKFYGTDGYTINPTGKQVFIEVNFNNPEDYDNESGVLSMNDSIYFYDYPKIIKEDLDSRGGGVILQVVKAISTFSKGKFEQQLECQLAVFFEKTVEEKAAKDAERPATPAAVTTGGGSGPHPRNTNNTNNTINVNAQAAARVKRQGTGSAPAPFVGGIKTEERSSWESPQSSINAQAAARIKRQGTGGAQTPLVKPKEEQTVTIPTKDGQRVSDDNAGVIDRGTKRKGKMPW